jgi:hypothetical protein
MAVCLAFQGIFWQGLYVKKGTFLLSSSGKTVFTSNPAPDRKKKGDGVPLEPRQPPMTPPFAPAMVVFFAALKPRLGVVFLFGVPGIFGCMGQALCLA